MSKTLSIALASYNGERYIGSQLQSIAEQTVLPFEIVISDDASTDQTPKIVKDFAARAPFPVHFITNSNRVGWQSNFTRAALQCSGDLIAFCDHDDFWLPAKIERVLHYAEAYKWLALLHANGKLLSTSVRIVPDAFKSLENVPRSAALFGGFDGHRMIFDRSLLPWLEHQDRFKDPLFDGKIAHDRLMMLAALTEGSALYVDDVLVLYRRHAEQVTTKNVERSTAADYSHRADVLSNWIASLKEFGATRVQDTTGFAKMVAVLERLRLAHLDRAALYKGEDAFERFRIFAKLIRQRSYRSRKEGAFGGRGFAKDLLLTLMPRIATSLPPS